MGTVRTFSAEDWRDAKAAWEAGDFSDEWEPFRRLAAGAGLIYPPSGGKWDSWGDPHPSQRAMLIRAIRETPDALRWALRSKDVGSWGNVVGLVLGERDATSEALDLEEAVEYDRPTHQEAAMTLADIFERIGVSIGYERPVPK